jgi:hypothetical protein
MFAIIAAVAIIGLPILAVVLIRHSDAPRASKPSAESLRAEAMANHPAGKGR